MTLESLPKSLNVLLLEKHAEDARFIQGLLTDPANTTPVLKIKTASGPAEVVRMAALETYHVLLISTGSVDSSEFHLFIEKLLAASPASSIVLLCDLGDEGKLSACKPGSVQDYLFKTRMEGAFLHKVLSNAYRIKQMQKAQRCSESLLNSVMDSILEGAVFINGALDISRANPAACRMLGCNESELKGRPYADVLLTGHQNEKMSVSALAFISKTLEDGVPRSVERVSLFDGMGKPLWVHCSAHPVFSGEKPSGAVLAFRSLSDALQKEDKLKDAIQEQLRNEQRLVEALSELKKLNQQLRETQDQLIQAEKLQSVGRLAAGVAHEVKNPLAILMQGAEYLQQTLSRKDEEVYQVLEDMLDAVRRADAVIKGLLDFSAPAEAEMCEADLREVIEESLQLVRHLMIQNKILVEKDFSPDLRPVVLDRSRMQQVFVNVFSNAIHAMKDGGNLTICVRPEPKQSPLRHVIVEITDTGTGIPVEILDKVCDPFVTTRRGKGGTGLGLSVVRGIMEIHQGDIRIANRSEGHGAVVTLRF